MDTWACTAWQVAKVGSTCTLKRRQMRITMAVCQGKRHETCFDVLIVLMVTEQLRISRRPTGPHGAERVTSRWKLHA